MSLATPEKIRSLQRKLYCKAKAEPAFRFYVLYDKICREDILRHAYGLARANAGAPGVDGVSFAEIEERGLEAWLAGLREELGREDVPARSGAAGDDPEARWRRRATARHSDHPGSGRPDRRQDRAGADLRGRLRGHCVWLSSPTRGGGRSQGSAPAYRPGLHRCGRRRFIDATSITIPHSGPAEVCGPTRCGSATSWRLIKMWLKAPIEERDGRREAANELAARGTSAARRKAASRARCWPTST